MSKKIRDPAILNPAAGTAEVITEDRRQEALLKAGALQSAIFNSANFSSIATDAKGVIQIFNVGAERMLGYAAADVMNKITPADISDPKEVIARAKALSAELGTPITPGFEALVFKASRGIEDIYELTYIRKDGSRFPAVVSVTALRDAQNTIIGYLLIGTDNTARKQIEAERQRLLDIQEETNKQLQRTNVTLQVSEEKLAVTLNSIGDAVIATDAEARVTLLNPLAVQLTGWTQAEATGRPVDEIFNIINKETRQPAVIPVMETLAHGTVQGLANHTVLIARGGSECDIADSCAPIRDRDAQVIGAVLVFRDVTGEYAVQQALRDSAAQIQTILNTVVDGIITLHAIDGTVETVNPAAERMFGYTAAELSGQKFSMLIPELDRDQHNGNGSLEYYSASDEARAIGLGREVVGRRKDGSIFPMEIAVSEMWLGGQRYFTGILRDNTARKQAEESLLKAGALQSAIFNSANFSSIATDAKGVIQIFNVGAERMLGYAAADVMNKITPADISDPKEVIARAKALSAELGTPITPGFEALVFKASRGIEDIYELTYIRKDGSRFPAVVSVTALRDDQDAIIGYLLIGTDNTARKQAEEALLKAGALQSAIFNSANFSSIATDAKGVIQIFNVGAERMLGYAAADVMNKITPADISDPKEVIARAKALSAELGTPITPGFEALVFKASRGIEDIYELTYIRKDGSRFPAVVSVTALRDDQDAIIGYLLIGTDNTARKQAEEALLKAGALQSAIFNSANFSSIATDAKGVIQIFNVGAERMLGYAAADVMNKITPADISDPKEVIARAKALSAELGTPITPGFEALVFKASRGIEDIYELTYIRKDGSRFPAVVSVTALRDDQDAIIGYLLIGTDNSARKQIEEEQKKLDQRLRDQQFYTRSLIESNIDALMTTDPSGIITDVNKQMEALTGCTRDELIGAPFKNYFTDPELAEAGIKLVLNEKKVTNYELTARARDGKETVVSFNATTLYDRDRRLQGVFAAARDVTERNRLDQALREKNIELESARAVADKANLAKSDFLSSMSHELRSPLNAILGFAQLMESDSPPATPSQLKSIVHILQAGWHLLKLINEILDLAVIESGQVPISQEPVALAEIMLECQGMIEPQAQQRGIKLTFPQFDIPLYVRADRTRLKQIFINLLSNSIKYNIKQGTVEVKCTESTPGRIRISIKDSGAGLPPEQMEQLFQPFNRLGQEAGSEEGTGIGLVVAKRLVELMGGAIGVESTVGVGSVFWFELISVAEPHLSMEGCEASVLAQPLVRRGAKLHTLLYVEDNPANMKLVEKIIARYPDIRLLTAVSGNSGIEIARASHPDVILMDINLPGISGFEALKILRADSATAHIPVVALSANAMPRDIENGLAAGFFQYLTKPIKVNEFLNILDEALVFAEKKSQSVQIMQLE
ncbi:PAS domain S-box protein [Candidatus Nitrotoga sp. 1052]|uniref:PAS domain S-box protein n=1 Tax=Candidatus Nitrotoga sp. 1052 TaxID=2886964 RepID=UPI001EF54E71|nr:PAS domain S-box protein [Candidatus Nitrotoga sp. 1052]CAH1084944.1 Histidine kinase [Candidatus Nitrotoga sp. 1052]